MDLKMLIALLGAAVAILVYLDTRQMLKLIRRTQQNLGAHNGSVGHLIDEYRKFKIAFESAYDMIVIADAEGTVLYGNDSIKRITGYSAGEAMGQKAGRLWGNQMSKDYYQQMWQRIKVEKKPFVGHLMNKRKDGSAYEAEITISPILHSNGKTVHYFVAVERVIGAEPKARSVRKK